VVVARGNRGGGGGFFGGAALFYFSGGCGGLLGGGCVKGVWVEVGVPNRSPHHPVLSLLTGRGVVFVFTQDINLRFIISSDYFFDCASIDRQSSRRVIGALAPLFSQPHAAVVCFAFFFFFRAGYPLCRDFFFFTPRLPLPLNIRPPHSALPRSHPRELRFAPPQSPTCIVVILSRLPFFPPPIRSDLYFSSSPLLLRSLVSFLSMLFLHTPPVEFVCGRPLSTFLSEVCFPPNNFFFLLSPNSSALCPLFFVLFATYCVFSSTTPPCPYSLHSPPIRRAHLSPVLSQ